MLAASQQSRFQRPVSKPETTSAQASLRDGTVGDAARSRFGEEPGARALAPAPLRLTLCERSHSHAPPILLEHRHWGFQGPGLEEQAAAGTTFRARRRTFSTGSGAVVATGQSGNSPNANPNANNENDPGVVWAAGAGVVTLDSQPGGCGGPDKPGANKTTPDTATRSCALRCHWLVHRDYFVRSGP